MTWKEILNCSKIVRKKGMMKKSNKKRANKLFWSCFFFFFSNFKLVPIDSGLNSDQEVKLLFIMNVGMAPRKAAKLENPG